MNVFHSGRYIGRPFSSHGRLIHHNDDNWLIGRSIIKSCKRPCNSAGAYLFLKKTAKKSAGGADVLPADYY